jgi:cell division protein FtsL
MIRIINLLLVVAVIGLSVGLYDIKYRAQVADREAQRLEAKIAGEQEAIRVLRAEWSYLNQPERLQELAARYTTLKPLTASQIGSFEDVPMPHMADDFYVPSGRQPLGGYAGVSPQDFGAGGSSIQ